MITTIKSTIVIRRNYIAVFEYFSDFRNDCIWRKEVTDTKVNHREMGVGVQIMQSSFLSNKVCCYNTELTCIEYIANKRIVCETNMGSKFWQKSTRLAEALSATVTRITYQLEFDDGIVKYGIGFSLPPIIITLYTKQQMKKYLSVLKRKIEENVK
jgi:hypothetical protein